MTENKINEQRIQAIIAEVEAQRNIAHTRAVELAAALAEARQQIQTLTNEINELKENAGTH